MIIVQPGSDAFQTAALYPVGAALVWAIAAIATRVMSRERPETTSAWSAIVGLVFLTPMVAFDWRSLGLWEVALALLTGVLSTVGHWLLIRGYRHGPASVLAPYSYVQLLFASLFGLVVFGVLPGIRHHHRRRRHRRERPLHRPSREGAAPHRCGGRHRAADLTAQLRFSLRPVGGDVVGALAPQPLVALAEIAAALLDPFELAVRTRGLVGIVLVDACVHPRLAGDSSAYFGATSRG